MVFFPPFFFACASVKGGMSSTPAAGPGAASAYANPPASPKRPAPGAAAYPPLPITSAPAPATFPSPIVFVLRFFFSPRTSPPRFSPALFPPAFAGDTGGASCPSFHTTPPGVSRFLFDLCFVLMGSSGIPSARSFASAASTLASASSTLEKLVTPGFLAASSPSTSRALASYARAAASAV